MILAERMMADTPLPPTYMMPGIPGAQGRLELGADMARHTSWRAGGRADRFYTPANLDDLAAFLGGLEPEEPVWFVGLGSNLLVRDGGLRGTVIHLHGALRNIAIEQRRQNGWAGQDSGKFGVIYAEAGVASPKVARFAANHDLVGAEFLAGIPGTVGGALAMNAGCYGHDTWEFVSQVLTIDRQGRIHRRGPKDFQVAYRHVTPREPRVEWFVAAWFMFPKGDGGQAREEIKRLLEKRIATPAPGFAQRRLGVPQSARRFRGASDRILRPQGHPHRRRPDLGETRQFHRQHRRRHRRRHRSADRRGPRPGGAAIGHRVNYGSEDHR
jgi:UDP-N-acetylenolpyruvoylglucosamine reductase